MVSQIFFFCLPSIHFQDVPTPTSPAKRKFIEPKQSYSGTNYWFLRYIHRWCLGKQTDGASQESG
jgi:hypothetical protein